MKTRADVIAATLKLLNALAAGQTPEPEDVAEIDVLIDGLVAELNERDIVSFSATDEFEDQFEDPLSILLADRAAPSFGQPRSPDSRGEAIARLYAMRPSTYVDGTAAPVDYF